MVGSFDNDDDDHLVNRFQNRYYYLLRKGLVMREENGRFCQSKPQASIEVTRDSLSVDGVELIRRASDNKMLRVDEELCRSFGITDHDYVLRDKRSKIVNHLNEGRYAEAVFLASLSKWPERQLHGANKANLNPEEPRAHGEWTGSSEGNTNLQIMQDGQYRGYFDDFVLDDLLQSLTSSGASAIKNVDVFGINGVLAIPDGLALPRGFPLPFFIEVKTGFASELTANQKKVYPLICAGGHAVSFDPRISRLGLVPGALLPPMRIMIAHTYGPYLPMTSHDYCKDFSQ